MTSRTTLRTIQGFALLLASLIFVSCMNWYAQQAASGQVADLVLDYLPLIDTGAIIVEGAIIFWTITTLLLIQNAATLPFITKSLATAIFARAIFISLTHLSVPVQNTIDYGLSGILYAHHDLFFSGHTAFPFLLALIYWNNYSLRAFFLANTVLFGASVLLAHVHYSIDVFGGLFVVYAIYHLSKKIFKEDYMDFLQAINCMGKQKKKISSFGLIGK